MKSVFLCIVLFLSINMSGQITLDKIDSFKVKQLNLNSGLANDSTLNIIYVDTSKKINTNAYFLNNELIDVSILNTLNTQSVEDISVKGDSIRINGVLYEGQIYINTKVNYNLKLITLFELKKKYFLTKNKPVIIMINGELVESDYNTYLLDENNLLTITIDSIEIPKENIDLGIMKILTKSSRNLEDRKKIRIR